MAAWYVRIEYDAVRDALVVHWRQEAGPYTKAKADTTTYDVTDVEDALSDVQRACRVLGARRLF